MKLFTHAKKKNLILRKKRQMKEASEGREQIMSIELTDLRLSQLLFRSAAACRELTEVALTVACLLTCATWFPCTETTDYRQRRTCTGNQTPMQHTCT